MTIFRSPRSPCVYYLLAFSAVDVQWNFQKERPQESLKVLCLTFSLSVVSAMLYDLRWCTLCVIKYCCFYIALYKRWRLLSHSMIVSDIRFMFESWHYKLIFFSRAFCRYFLFILKNKLNLLQHINSKKFYFILFF